MSSFQPEVFPSSGCVERTTDKSAFYKLAGIGGAVTLLTVAAPFAYQAGGDNAFIAVTVPTGLLTLAATTLADRSKEQRALWLIFGLAIVLRGYALAFQPFLSTDIYRYIWDGNVQAAGINPYRYVPADPALVFLRDAAIFPNINRADYAITIYPPIAEFFFFAVTRAGSSTLVMRLALLGCETVSVAITLLFLRRMRCPATRIVAYVWHPLPIWEIANSGHVDALMVALMLLGLWLALTGHRLRGAILIALASLAKPFAAPTLAAIWRPWDWKMPLTVIATASLCYLPYVSAGWNVFGFLLKGYFNEEGLVSGDGYWLLSLWRLIAPKFASDVAVYTIMAGLLLLGLALRVAFRPRQDVSRTLTDANVLLLVVLLLLSPEYPWYFLMIVPFVALLGWAETWAASIGALLLTNENLWDPHIPWVISKSVLFGSVLACWAYGVWIVRRTRLESEELERVA